MLPDRAVRERSWSGAPPNVPFLEVHLQYLPGWGKSHFWKYYKQHAQGVILDNPDEQISALGEDRVSDDTGGIQNGDSIIKEMGTLSDAPQNAVGAAQPKWQAWLARVRELYDKQKAKAPPDTDLWYSYLEEISLIKEPYEIAKYVTILNPNIEDVYVQSTTRDDGGYYATVWPGTDGIDGTILHEGKNYEGKKSSSLGLALKSLREELEPEVLKKATSYEAELTINKDWVNVYEQHYFWMGNTHDRLREARIGRININRYECDDPSSWQRLKTQIKKRLSGHTSTRSTNELSFNMFNNPYTVQIAKHLLNKANRPGDKATRSGDEATGPDDVASEPKSPAIIYFLRCTKVEEASYRGTLFTGKKRWWEEVLDEDLQEEYLTKSGSSIEESLSALCAIILGEG
ncbi:hypothetical protein CC80DRAFT_536657 [Byssothecium circinans]|uniref:Uncharacterized protein n=1 Tax=Byssothecium circinans TaxID=147558 RepID=A0A6A5TQC7_9PLEO|nr:hypothetical protein CC80DRAFT_536657 [Byssothecium circinans]